MTRFGRSFLGILPGPRSCHFLSLTALAAFPALHRRAHRGASLHAQIWCNARPGHPVSATLPVLEPVRGSPEPAGPCPHRDPQDILTRSCGASLASLASSLALPSLNSADSSQSSALSYFSHFFSPLLQFDSSSPRNRICTKAATPNLDLHTPLRFVF